VQELMAVPPQLQDGDSIFINAGIYNITDSLQINNSVTIRGNKNSKDTSVIVYNGEGWPAAAIVVNAANVKVRDLTIMSYQTGIYINIEGINFQAKRVTVLNTRYGIYPTADNYLIEDSFISGSQIAGINPTYSGAIGSIVDTVISYCGYAIWSQFGSDLEIKGSKLVNNTYPILLTQFVGSIKLEKTIMAGNRFAGDFCNVKMDELVPPQVLNNPKGSSFECSDCTSCKFKKSDFYKDKSKHEDKEHDDKHGEDDDDEDNETLNMLLDFFFGSFWMNMIKQLLVFCCPTCRL